MIRRIAIALTIAALPLTACSSSSIDRDRSAGSCSWPADVSRLALGTAAAAPDGSRPGGVRLLAFDVSSGRVVGDCALSAPDPSYSPELEQADGEPYPSAGFTFVGASSPVIGANLTFAPDNSGDRGAVRDLRNGKVDVLSFSGWKVVTTAGQHLLLTRSMPGGDAFSTSPADWCVLPEPTAALSRCAVLPGADVRGTGFLAPDGSPQWCPLVGRTMTVGGLAVTAALSASGYVGAAGVPSTGARLGAGADGHTIIFAPGRRGPAGRTTLQWLRVGAHGTEISTRLYTSSVTDQDSPTWSEPPTSVVASPDGATLFVSDAGGTISSYSTTGPGPAPLAVHLPSGTGLFRLVRWPSTQLPGPADA